MSTLIPHTYLRKGIETILRNVGTLLDTADLLHRNKKYLHSAVFSELAVEEMAKVQVLIDYHEKREDLPIAEWARLSHGGGAHEEKQREYILRLLAENPSDRAKIPETGIAKEMIDMMVGFHVRLKQKVLYVDWDRKLNTWRWWPEIYSEEDQIKISTPLLNVRKRYREYLERYVH